MYKNRIVEQKMMSPLELRENPKNWRKHPKVQADGLNAVLDEIGWVQSVILNKRTGLLIDGHLRIELAIKNKETEVPVVVVDLSPEEEDAILASFDPISAMAQVNHTALSALIQGITTTSPALRDLIDTIQKKNQIITTPKDEKELNKAPSRVKAGEVWQLGKHIIMCADCTVPTNWDTLLGDVRAELCFTSPPYNVGSKTAGYKGESKRYLNDSDEKDSESYLRLLQDFSANALSNCDELLVNIGLVAGNKKAVIQYLSKYSDAYKDTIYWVKSNAAPHVQEGVINNRVEPIYAFGDGTRKFRHANFPQGTYWNVIEGAGASGNPNSGTHKATFPQYLPQNIIENFTKAGENVVDPFIGTGTTLMACEVAGRVCFGMDIEPEYLDITIDRWEKETGETAVKANE
jgi:DNA modification methylase